MLRLLAAVCAEVFRDHSNGAKTSRGWVWVYIGLVVLLAGLAAWHWRVDGVIRAWAFAKNALFFVIWAPLLWVTFKARFQRRRDLVPLMVVLMTLLVIFHQFVLPLEIGK